MDGLTRKLVRNSVVLPVNVTQIVHLYFEEAVVHVQRSDPEPNQGGVEKSPPLVFQDEACRWSRDADLHDAPQH